MGKLSDVKIRTASTADRDLFLSDGAGLYVRVRKSGTKLWLYRYKVGTTTRWHEIGSYPSVSLTYARAEAARLAVMRREGIDPVERRQEELAAKEAEAQSKAAEKERLACRRTLEQAARSWFAAPGKRSKKPKSEELVRSFERDVFPIIGSKHLEDVTKGDVRELLAGIERRGSMVMARHVTANLRQFFDYCVSFDWIALSPAATIKRSDIGAKANERDRVLSEAEIRALPEAIKNARLIRSTELAVWIMLATCCRVGEIASAKWEQVDLDSGEWRIPAEDAKNRHAHVISLSGFAIAAFAELKQLAKDKANEKGENVASPWVMPARYSDGHVDERSIAKQISDRQRGELEPMTNRSPNTSALVMPGGRWTPHDLRRTGATLMVSLGVIPEVADRCLNHLEQNRMRRIYLRHDYAVEMKDAWQRLGMRLSMLCCVPSR